jgi:SAM-dependent methyltransferase
MRPDAILPTPTDFDPPLTACPLCGYGRIAHFDHDFRNVRIDECGRCGVKFMNPQYTDRYLTALYGQYNDPQVAAGDVVASGRLDDVLPRKRDENFKLIARHTEMGRLLSIGSGAGDEIRAALAAGWKVEGYDVDKATTDALARNFNVPVYSGDLATSGLPGDAYNCVYMDQVLEHPKDPAAYLRLAHRVLRRGGVLYLGVPNIASVSAVYKTLIGRARLKPFRGRHYDTWHHLFYYSPRTLTRILEEHFDFDVVLVQGDPIARNTTAAARAADALRTRFARLDSSFRVLARPRK